MNTRLHWKFGRINANFPLAWLGVKCYNKMDGQWARMGRATPVIPTCAGRGI